MFCHLTPRRRTLKLPSLLMTRVKGPTYFCVKPGSKVTFCISIDLRRSGAIAVPLKGPMSGEQFRHDAARYIGEPEIPAGVAVGEFLVIESEQVQQRRVQVMHVYLVLRGGEAELVGRSMDVAAFDAATGDPHREAIGIMVPAIG